MGPGVVSGNSSKERTESAESLTPRDENIKFKYVCLVDSKTGDLGPLTPLSEIIRSVRNMNDSNPTNELASGEDNKNTKWWKRQKFCVELAAETPTPIVKIVHLGQEYRKNRESAKKKKEKIVKEKEVQMSWSVAEGDFDHKLKKTKEALEEGERVVIGFTRKKGQPFPKPEAMQARLQETVEALSDLAEEWKGRVMESNYTGFVYLRKKS